MRRFEINGYPMAYVEEGTGDPLVTVHGSLSDYRYWARQAVPLSASLCVVSVSLRHYYPERWDGIGDDFTTRQHVKDVARFIDVLGAGPVHLLGHSRGGNIAFWVGRYYPAARSVRNHEMALLEFERRGQYWISPILPLEPVRTISDAHQVCGNLRVKSLIDRHGGTRVLPASNLLFAAALASLAIHQNAVHVPPKSLFTIGRHTHSNSGQWAKVPHLPKPRSLAYMKRSSRLRKLSLW